MSFDFGFGVSLKHALFLAILSVVAAFGPMASEMLFTRGRKWPAIATALSTSGVRGRLKFRMSRKAASGGRASLTELSAEIGERLGLLEVARRDLAEFDELADAIVEHFKKVNYQP